MKWNAYRWLGLAFLALAAAGVSLSFLHGRLLYLGDTVVYLEGARALAAGEGYRVNGEPHTAWPPGYPAALALLMLTGMRSVVAFKLLNHVFAWVALACFYGVLARMRGRRQALLSVLVTACFLPWIYYTHAVLSDLMFASLAACFLWTGLRYRETGDGRWLWAATVAGMVLPLVRMAGVAFLPGWMYLAIAGRNASGTLTRSVPGGGEGGAGRNTNGIVIDSAPRDAVRVWGRIAAQAVLVVAPVVLWSVRNWILAGRPTSVATGVTAEYVSSLAQVGIDRFSFLLKVWINLRGYTHILVLPDQAGIARIGELGWIVRAGCVVATVCAGVGYVAAWRTRAGRFPAFVVLCYGGMLLTHNWYDIRYLLPILPFYLTWMADGVAMGIGLAWRYRLSGVPGRWTAEVVTRWARVCVLGAMLAGCLAVDAGSGPARRLRSARYDEGVQALHGACEAIRGSGIAGDVLVAGGAGYTGWWSGRRIVSLVSQMEGSELRDLRIPPGVVFVLAGRGGGGFVDYQSRYMDLFLEANRGRLIPYVQRGDVIVYRVEGEED